MADQTEQETVNLVITVPHEKVNLAKLDQILNSREGLIKKALRADDLSVTIDSDGVHFPWFHNVETANGEPAIYGKFITALCARTMENRRINAKQHSESITNEKYSFRCFLLQLGYIGPEYNEDRKVLLRYLSGPASGKEYIPVSKRPD